MASKLSGTNQGSGLYNAVAAFCEGLYGPVAERLTTDRKYMSASYSRSGSRWQSVHLRLQTQQARDWWILCTSSKLFPMKTIINKWRDAKRTTTQWKTIQVPESILDKWRGIACESGVKVSTFDLFASWIHMASNATFKTRSRRSMVGERQY